MFNNILVFCQVKHKGYNISHITSLKDNFEYHLLNSHWIVADIAKNDYKINELTQTILAVKGKPYVKINDGSNININNHIDQVNVSAFNNNKVASPSFDIKKYKVPLIIAAAVLAVIIVIVMIFKAIAGFFIGIVKDDDAVYADNKIPISETVDKPYDNDSKPQPEDNSKNNASAEDISAYDCVQIPVHVMPYEHSTQILNNDPKNSFKMAGREYNTGVIFTKKDGSYMLINNADL